MRIKQNMRKMKLFPKKSLSVSAHCPLTPMEVDEVKKSLWHAFDVLDESSEVKKTRLRVLTNNLGHVLGVEHAETIWDRVEEDSIDFQYFIKVLNSSLLVGLTNSSNPRTPTLRSELDNLCWMLCERHYKQMISAPDKADDTEGTPSPSRFDFSSNDLFKMWKIFNFLGERDEKGEALFPLRIDVEEAERVVSEIRCNVGLPKTKEMEKCVNGKGESEQLDSFLLDYCQFVKVIEEGMDLEEATDVIAHGISEVYNQIVSDVVRKGHLVKFGNKVTTWKERWFVLTTSLLKYYVSSEERDLKGSIILCAGCFSQSFPDKPGGKHHRLKLHTPNKEYELAASDLRSKNEWISDIRRVTKNIGITKESYQVTLWKERKKEREDRRRQTAEEELLRCATQEKLKEQDIQLVEERKQRERAEAGIQERENLLQEERQRRLAEDEERKIETDQLLEAKRQEIETERQKHENVESRLKAEREQLLVMNQEMLEAEREQRAQLEERIRDDELALAKERTELMDKLRELEETKDKLENMVEEERALKKDEEIVRTLQSKILEDEIAKREELERLQEEQKRDLLLEKMTRIDLEEVQIQQEEELLVKQKQLEALTEERQQADKNLEDAVEKLKHAEEGRQLVEQKLKLKEMNSSSRMARGVPTLDPNPFITHRGLGAFTETDFTKKALDENGKEDLTELGQDTECLTIHEDSSDEPEK